MTLQCQTRHPYDTYILCRHGEAPVPQHCSRQKHGSFLISSVSLAQAGTYVCYGAPSHSPSLWSLPSEPLKVSITRE